MSEMYAFIDAGYATVAADTAAAPALTRNYQTPLITAAIEMAAHNLNLPPGAIFRSYRSSNYTSAEFATVLKGLGIRQSAGRTGICYGKAPARVGECGHQGRAGQPDRIPGTEEGRKRYCAVHRASAQSNAPSLRTRVPDSARGPRRVSESAGSGINNTNSSVRKTRGSPGCGRGTGAG